MTKTTLPTLRRWLSCLPLRRRVFSNIAEGTHAGNLTQYLETTVLSRYTLGKPGAASGGLLVAGAADKPLGVITDEGVSGDPVNLALLGSASSTLLARAGASISAGDALVPNATGQAIPLPATPGTYYVIGQAVADASSGALVEFDPTVPYAVTVS